MDEQQKDIEKIFNEKFEIELQCNGITPLFLEGQGGYYCS